MNKKPISNPKNFVKDNEEERMRFVEQWAEYVRTHPAKDWSRQQNVIINSALRTANITPEQFLQMKKEKYKK
jgi:hypothetical protein